MTTETKRLAVMDIVKLAETLAAATPGPWVHKRMPGYGEDQIEGDEGFCICDVEFVMFCTVGGYLEGPKQRKPKPGEPDANAALIAIAPDLAAEVIRLSALVAELTAANAALVVRNEGARIGFMHISHCWPDDFAARTARAWLAGGAE